MTQGLPDSSTFQAFPDQDIDDIIGATPGDDVRDVSLSPSDSSALNSNYLVPPIPNVPSSSPTPGDASETEDLAHIALTEEFRKISLMTFDDRFFGQSR